MYIVRTTIDIHTILGLPNYGTHYHQKSSHLPHLICLKATFSIFMFPRDQVIPLPVRIHVQDISSVFCSLHVHSLVFFYLNTSFSYFLILFSQPFQIYGLGLKWDATSVPFPCHAQFILILIKLSTSHAVIRYCVKVIFFIVYDQ